MNDKEIAKVLIKATAKYTHKNIEHEGNREYYKQGIIDCLRKIDSENRDLNWIKCLIEGLKERSVFMKKRKMFSLVRPREYYVLALDQVLEICVSIDRRFTSGSSFPSFKAPHTLDIPLKEDDGLFE